MTFRSVLSILSAACIVLGCAEGDPARAPAAEGDSAVHDDTDTSASVDSGSNATLLPPVVDGSPMPSADQAGGVPPYPGAVVHLRTPRDEPGMRVIEAFTPDDWETVIAWYDSTLAGAGWGRTEARDMVFYELENDRAAVTISPWEAEHLGDDAPDVLRRARTAIGVAWRTDTGD